VTSRGVNPSVTVDKEAFNSMNQLTVTESGASPSPLNHKAVAESGASPAPLSSNEDGSSDSSSADSPSKPPRRRKLEKIASASLDSDSSSHPAAEALGHSLLHTRDEVLKGETGLLHPPHQGLPPGKLSKPEPKPRSAVLTSALLVPSVTSADKNSPEVSPEKKGNRLEPGPAGLAGTLGTPGLAPRRSSRRSSYDSAVDGGLDNFNRLNQSERGGKDERGVKDEDSGVDRSTVSVGHDRSQTQPSEVPSDWQEPVLIPTRPAPPVPPPKGPPHPVADDPQDDQGYLVPVEFRVDVSEEGIYTDIPESPDGTLTWGVTPPRATILSYNIKVFLSLFLILSYPNLLIILAFH